MKWKKLGPVVYPKGKKDWHYNSALTPTPLLLNENTIRVYAGFRDREGISRIGYVDLDADNPLKVQAVSNEPVLNIGKPGCFDDNGVILGDVVRYRDHLRMYYVGFQIVRRAKFLAFTGIAESNSSGENFTRVKQVPILDRTDGAMTIRAVHTAIHEDNKWKIWYAAGHDWQMINDIPYPKYTIWYSESPDGLSSFKPGVLCIDTCGDEYRIGRPSVYRNNNQYYMFYTKGGISGKDYFPGVAVSKDGINWIRKDEDLGLSLSDEGFDSIHLCYPRLITARGKTYCTYNGNNMGIDGFGIAELLAW